MRRDTERGNERMRKKGEKWRRVEVVLNDWLDCSISSLEHV